MQNLITVSTVLAVTATAIVKDSCQPGSDTACVTFGSNMCCAHIQYYFSGEDQEFYGCASRPGIEYTKGQILDGFGYSGSWYCADAITMSTSLVITAALILASTILNP